MSIANNIRAVQDRIAEAALRAGRHPSDVTLVAVTKTRTAGEVREAADAGLVHFGENRVQEAEGKIPGVGRDAVWHLIGPLQSNKAARAVELFNAVDTVHSVKIAGRLSRFATEAGITLDVLVQVNISGEESKSGVAREKVGELLRTTTSRDGLRLRGLLTIGSLGVPESVTRAEFARMRELFDEFRSDTAFGQDFDTLSMGMSDDYEMAVEEGATAVRVGTALFGPRT